MKMPTIVGIFTFISRENFMLSWVEHEKKFYNLGARLLLSLCHAHYQNCNMHKFIIGCGLLIGRFFSAPKYVEFSCFSKKIWVGPTPIRILYDVTTCDMVLYIYFYCGNHCFTDLTVHISTGAGSVNWYRSKNQIYTFSLQEQIRWWASHRGIWSRRLVFNSLNRKSENLFMCVCVFFFMC